MAWGNGLFREARIKFEQWNNLEIGYLAGIIDGEGCLNLYTCIDKKKIKKTYTYCRLTINTTDILLSNWLKEKIGVGGVNKEQRKKPKPHHKQVYIYLMAAERDLLNLLLWIEPHLIIKKQKARECIEFLKNKIT